VRSRRGRAGGRAPATAASLAVGKRLVENFCRSCGAV
jgi:hypothetical protein